MNRDLFLAVLAMDSYNRGYNSGIDDLSNDNVGTQLGSAVIIGNADDPAGTARAASFYAVAYQWHGETIISFRGTDDTSFNFSPTDISAWLGGIGSQTGQAGLAAQFYRDISPTNNPDVTFTGHSLGGGLAGLMGSLYGREAVVFDNMAYGAAAQGVYYNATHPVVPEAIADLVTYVPNPRYQSTLDTYYRNAPVQPPDSSHVSGYQVSGQVLQGTQSTGTALGSDLHLGMWLSTFQLHSMSLLVTLMYG
ncbi:MAG: hypothetical protein ACRD9S_24845, partial [Pyrinomonadaceae bacterium]